MDQRYTAALRRFMTFVRAGCDSYRYKRGDWLAAHLTGEGVFFNHKGTAGDKKKVTQRVLSAHLFFTSGCSSAVKKEI
jgi:hypothetical protein